MRLDRHIPTLADRKLKNTEDGRIYLDDDSYLRLNHREPGSGLFKQENPTPPQGIKWQGMKLTGDVRLTYTGARPKTYQLDLETTKDIWLWFTYAIDRRGRHTATIEQITSNNDYDNMFINIFQLTT